MKRRYGVFKIIPDIADLTMLRVRAKINSFGEIPNVGSLNIPGQRYTGAVHGSCIDGIFEIEPVRTSHHED